MPDLRQPPLPFDDARAGRTLEALAAQGFAPPDAAARDLLTAAFGNSPYLARLAERDPDILRAYFSLGAEAMAKAATESALAVSGLEDEARTMAELRRAKRRAAFAIALADISGAWDVATVTGALSRFADAAVRGALRFLLAREAVRS